MTGPLDKFVPAGLSAIALAALATLLATPPAFAQATLQQRIEALEREARALRGQLEEQKQENEKTREMAVKSAGGKKVVTSGNDDVSLKVYGQVNRAVLFANDGEHGGVLYVDNDMSSSRAGFEGKAKVSDRFTASSKIEVEAQSNPSNDADLQDKDDNGSQVGFTIRKVEFTLADKKLGKLTMGQASEANDGAAEVDISGTGVFLSSLQDTFGGGIKFRNDSTGALSSVRIKDAFPNFDGSREDLAKYQTPNFAGFVATAVAESDDRYGFSLEWSGKFASIKGEAMIAYQDLSGATNSNPNTNYLVGSASFMHDSGFSLTGAAGRKKVDNVTPSRDDGVYYYIKGGYQMKAFEFGKTSFGIDYYSGSDMVANGDDSWSWGFGVVQKVDRAALELYAGVRFYQYDNNTADFDTVTVGMTGGRIKF